MDAFRIEYNIACNKASLCGENSFTGLIHRHALVMIDAAHKDVDKHQSIKLGARLRDVQTDWINLLCRHEKSNNEYRRIVTKIVCNFADKLMDVVLDDKFVSYDELASIGKFHSNLGPQHQLKQTRELFQDYVLHLCKAYRAKSEEDYARRCAHCLQVANALGSWLDITVYK